MTAAVAELGRGKCPAEVKMFTIQPFAEKKFLASALRTALS